MKKILRNFVFVLAGVLTVVALASCGHSHKWTYESDDTKHRQVCECGEKTEYEAHTWGDWTVTTPATEDAKGSRKHTCTVCGKEVSEAIDELKPETMVATELTAVYAQVPAEWETVNIYYWNNLTGEDNTLSDDYKVVWPGVEMTEVDAESHLYGFKVPAGVNMIIFNDGDSQTVDIELGKTKNLYVLDTEAEDLKAIAISYRTYTPKDTDPALGEPVVTKIEKLTLYAQLPASWAEQKLHFWGLENTEWPGTDMTVVDAENNIYKYDDFIKNSGFILNSGDGSQTANLALFEDKDINIIIVAEDNSVSYGKYADGVITPVEVEIDKTITELYVVGSMNSWTKKDEFKMTVADNTATIELELAAEAEFKLFDGDWNHDWATFGYVDSLGEAFANKDGNIKVVTAGTYVITVSSLNDTPVLTITAK